MRYLYSILVALAGLALHVVGWFHPKIRLFVQGRRKTKSVLRDAIDPTDRVLWFHAASLGEFEQGLPVMEQVKRDFPMHKILVTFFSPSGYEVRKNTQAAHVVCYLPLDTVWNVKSFLDQVQPELAVFVKYEFWPNYLHELRERRVPTLLISAIFRPDQVFFRWWGGWMRKALRQFDHLFVQDMRSKALLHTIGVQRVTVSGDTRFDRVAEILERDNSLDFMDSFVQNRACVVAGSTWPDDMKVLFPAINDDSLPFCWVIAPHHIKEDDMVELSKQLSVPWVRFSSLSGREESLESKRVLILDTVGLLTKVYSYAKIAYVGGGMGSSGLHNTLEPAVFGIPVVTGPAIKGFREAEQMAREGGLKVVRSGEEVLNLLRHFYDNPQSMNELGELNRNYTKKNTGAMIQITHYIRITIK